MATEKNLERIVYTLETRGQYYVINKVKIQENTKAEILKQYLYPINGSHIKSIVKEIGDNRIFGISLKNSMTLGTFVFSPEGINEQEYIDTEMGVPYTYEDLLEFFIYGGKNGGEILYPKNPEAPIAEAQP